MKLSDFKYDLPEELIAQYPTDKRGTSRLMVMDRDGSNRKALFPSLESQGIEPSQDWGQWSPAPLGTTGHYNLAILYQGNIWLVDAVTGKSLQVTGDGQIARILWQ